MFWDKNGIGTVPVGDGVLTSAIMTGRKEDAACLGLFPWGLGNFPGWDNHSMSSLGVSISVVGRCR